MLAVLRALRSAAGRRYLRAVWRTIRENHRQPGATLHPTTPYVTLTVVRHDGRLHRVHHIPARYVDDFVDNMARSGAHVLIAEETDG